MGFGRYLGPLRNPIRAARRTVRKIRKDQWTRKLRASVASCGTDLRVNGPCRVSGGDNVRLGNNVNFNGMIIWGAGGVDIGDNFHSGVECKIISHNHDYDGGTRIPYDESVVHKPVKIGDNVWLGHNVIIVPGATIGEGAVIGAGAVVSGNIDRCAVAVGNPATVVKYRDIDHYEDLKAKGMFH